MMPILNREDVLKCKENRVIQEVIPQEIKFEHHNLNRNEKSKILFNLIIIRSC
jgi:chemotaxis methyl-accepting protein methylase